MQQRIIIIAGPNGAGKTTFARAFLPNEEQPSTAARAAAERRAVACVSIISAAILHRRVRPRRPLWLNSLPLKKRYRPPPTHALCVVLSCYLRQKLRVCRIK